MLRWVICALRQVSAPDDGSDAAEAVADSSSSPPQQHADSPDTARATADADAGTAPEQQNSLMPQPEPLGELPAPPVEDAGGVTMREQEHLLTPQPESLEQLLAPPVDNADAFTAPEQNLRTPQPETHDELMSSPVEEVDLVIPSGSGSDSVAAAASEGPTASAVVQPSPIQEHEHAQPTAEGAPCGGDPSDGVERGTLYAVGEGPSLMHGELEAATPMPPLPVIPETEPVDGAADQATAAEATPLPPAGPTEHASEPAVEGGDGDDSFGWVEAAAEPVGASSNAVHGSAATIADGSATALEYQREGHCAEVRCPHSPILYLVSH